MANEISTIIEGARERFAEIAASTPTSVPLNFAREATFAVQILAANGFAANVALSNPESLVSAVTQVAAVGLSLNPVAKHAYLVPRKVGSAGMKICLDVGAQGYVELARKAGVKDVWYGIVREHDQFIFPSPGEKVVHRIDPWSDRGEMRGTFCQHVLMDGTPGQCVTLKREEIIKRMQASEGWKAHHVSKKAQSCIWCAWPDEMALKTVLRYARRWWPQTPELDRAITTLDAEDSDIIEPEATDRVVGGPVEEGEWTMPPMPPREDLEQIPTAETIELIDPATKAALILDIEQAGLPVQTLLSAYRIKSLDLLPADKVFEACERVAAFAAKKAAKAGQS